MAKVSSEFAQFCCELLASQGACLPKRMFGGYGISIEGMTLAIIADLGEGEKLFLKGDADCRAQYEAAGCKIFTYDMGGTPKSMNYFSAPEDAMDSADAMRAWARLAMDCAVRARGSKSKAKSMKKPYEPAGTAPKKRATMKR